jgi:hypothetical protein
MQGPPISPSASVRSPRSGVSSACSLMACVLLVASASTPSADAGRGAVLVGVLEEVPGVYAGESSHNGVRALFRRVASSWQPFPNTCSSVDCVASITSKYPAYVRWTISFEGRALGDLAAHTPKDFKFYSHIGVQDLDAGQRVPVVGVPAALYSGFDETPVHRPLLATSGSTPRTSSAGWHSQTVDPADLYRVWPTFQRLVPLIDDCRVDSAGEFITSDGRAPQLEEFEIESTWVDRHGNAILEARIRPNVFENCDGPLSHVSDYWFYREASGKVRPLPGQEGGERAGLVMPLDFADVTGDGQDTALFLMSGYNAGGYALFFDGFQHVVHFTWGYH